MKFKISGLFCGLCAVVFLGGNVWDFAEGDEKEKESFRVEFGKDAFPLIEAELLERVLSPFSQGDIDDFSDKVDGGIEIEVQGLSYEMTFADLDLELHDDAFSFRVKIKDGEIKAEKIKLKKKILGATLRSTCEDTRILLGFHKSMEAYNKLTLDVVDGHIEGESVEVGFDLSDRNYEVKGPKSCTGDLGTGYLIKLTVEKVLENARRRLMDAVESRLEKLAEELGKNFDRNLNREFSFEQNILNFPKLQFTVQTKPANIRLSKSGWSFGLDANVLSAQSKIDIELGKDSEDVRSLASLAFNVDLFEKVSSEMMRQGVHSFWIDVERFPQSRELLSFHSASSIWPDLLTRISDDHEDKVLSVQMILHHPPRLTPDLKLQIDQLELRFYLPDGEKPEAYFHTLLDLELPLKLEVAQDQLLLSVQKLGRMEIKGGFAEKITPNPDWYEKDILEILLKSMLDFLVEGDQNLSLKMPSYEFGGETIGFNGMRVKDAYLILDMGIAQ